MGQQGSRGEFVVIERYSQKGKVIHCMWPKENLRRRGGRVSTLLLKSYPRERVRDRRRVYRCIHINSMEVDLSDVRWE